MIIESIKITNFGLYRGENYIQLQPDNLLNRNVTVILGQNGVGKSTLQEAIHLCLLGSLSINNRVSELTYEKYLLKRSYRGETRQVALSTSLELNIQFLKSGSVVNYKIIRCWTNDPSNLLEEIRILEDGKELSELNKKEKNLFLRELIQPGLAKVMFFDGEKLLSLYDERNLSEFIGESCKYLFGLNFVELLNTDLSHYINKLYSRQDHTKDIVEIKKLKDTIQIFNAEIISHEDSKAVLIHELSELKMRAADAEKLISDQGRWIVDKLDIFKFRKQTLENNIAFLKKNLSDTYSTLGPFVFCKTLVMKLRDRLTIECEIEKWVHARELMSSKIRELESTFSNPEFLKSLQLDSNGGKKVVEAIEDSIMTKPSFFLSDDRIHHVISDNQRTEIIAWIDDILKNISGAIISKSQELSDLESSMKLLNKEQSSFSKEDAIADLLQEIQLVNKSIGSSEQKLSSVIRKIEEANKKKEFHSHRLVSLEERVLSNNSVDKKLKLSSKTKNVLEAYANQLLTRKLLLLSEKVLVKFNLLCRKDSYLDSLSISPLDFKVTLSRRNTIVEPGHLSAGEKQLLILSFLWGLRELTNIALPLIIDTPLARLDIEHRKTFIEQFLPEIQPQVILIGTDMELSQEVIEAMENHISHQYNLQYDSDAHQTKITEVERKYREGIKDEV